jgi:hypothetical protein
LRVVADPLRDIGLRSHDALPERTSPSELEMFVLTMVGLRDCTDQEHDLHEIHDEKSSSVIPRVAAKFVSRKQRAWLDCPYSAERTPGTGTRCDAALSTRPRS